MNSSATLQTNRRSVLKLGLAGAALLGGGGWIATRLADGSPEALIPDAQILSPGAQQMMAKLTDAFLSHMLPEDDAARAAMLVKTTSFADNMISQTPPWIQKELLDLLSLMTFAPGRFLLTGRWGGWEAARREDIVTLLQDLKDSSITLRRFLYVALHDLSTGGFYALPENWELVGYDGPLLEGPGEEV